jgi:hypothetical protein
MKKTRAGKSTKKLGKAKTLRRVKSLIVRGPVSRTGGLDAF